MTKQIMHPRRKGMLAYKSHQTQAHNPYHPLTKAHTLWLRGFWEQKRLQNPELYDRVETEK